MTWVALEFGALVLPCSTSWLLLVAFRSCVCRVAEALALCWWAKELPPALAWADADMPPFAALPTYSSYP